MESPIHEFSPRGMLTENGSENAALCAEIDSLECPDFAILNDWRVLL
jgi:hypothetical protein